MKKRRNLNSDAPWEKKVGYSRAVQVGERVFVTGTVAINEAQEVVGDDEYSQTKFILEKIERVLENLGGSRKDVVRTRMFVTNIQNWEGVGNAHGEFFKGVGPATTMVEVSGLISPEYLVEIEADAIIGCG